MRREKEDRRDAKRLKYILEELREEGVMVFVEGKKDVYSLSKAGLKAYPLKGRHPEPKGRVVILTDLDEEGERLAKEYKNKWESRKGVDLVDTKTRKYLGAILGITQFEGFWKSLSRKLEELKEVI